MLPEKRSFVDGWKKMHFKNQPIQHTRQRCEVNIHHQANIKLIPNTSLPTLFFVDSSDCTHHMYSDYTQSKWTAQPEMHTK